MRVGKITIGPETSFYSFQLTEALLLTKEETAGLVIHSLHWKAFS